MWKIPLDYGVSFGLFRLVNEPVEKAVATINKAEHPLFLVERTAGWAALYVRQPSCYHLLYVHLRDECVICLLFLSFDILVTSGSYDKVELDIYTR